MKVIESKKPWFDKLHAECTVCSTVVRFDSPDDMVAYDRTVAPALYAWTCPSCGVFNTGTREEFEAESADITQR